jgi:hypothetical protein
MRSYSTPESANGGEVTKLAIAEALASVALYVWFCAAVGSWRSLALIVVAAPLMLFRTEGAADWALRHYTRWHDWRYRRGCSPMGLGLIAATPIVGMTLRVIGTVYWGLRRPLDTLREAPGNWFRQTLCTDFMHPPEIVPLEALKRPEKLFLFAHFVEVWEDLRQSLRTGLRTFPRRLRTDERLDMREVVVLSFVYIFFAAPFWIIMTLVIILIMASYVVVGWVPSAVYRLSFKATAIVYAPFMLAAYTTLQSSLPLKLRLERITKGVPEKALRKVSWMVFAGTGVNAAFGSGLPTARSIESLFRLPWWQVTALIGAFLTFVLLWFADSALARHEHGRPWPEQTVMNVTSVISFARWVLFLLTLGHIFGLAFRVAFPSVAWPWQ